MIKFSCRIPKFETYVKISLNEGNNAVGLVSRRIGVLRTNIAKNAHVKATIEGGRAQVGLSTDPCSGYC